MPKKLTRRDINNLALEGQKYLRLKWEGDYGNGYPLGVRERRLYEIAETIAALKDIIRATKK